MPDRTHEIVVRQAQAMATEIFEVGLYKPSIPGVTGGFAVKSADIVIGLSTLGHGCALTACTTDVGRATGTRLHDAYAKAMRT